MKKIAIMASGSGSNAETLAMHFKNHPVICIAVVLTNNPRAGVIQRAVKLKIPCHLITKEELESEKIVELLSRYEVDFIVLAGFLLKIPPRIISEYSGRIINIHPALLPKYGGKGMYGMHAHKAVIKNGERESGITIHLVDEIYDHGKQLFQAKVALEPEDSPESLSSKIHELEHKHFPQVIEDYVLSFT